MLLIRYDKDFWRMAVANVARAIWLTGCFRLAIAQPEAPQSGMFEPFLATRSCVDLKISYNCGNEGHMSALPRANRLKYYVD